MPQCRKPHVASAIAQLLVDIVITKDLVHFIVSITSRLTTTVVVRIPTSAEHTRNVAVNIYDLQS